MTRELVTRDFILIKILKNLLFLQPLYFESSFEKYTEGLSGEADGAMWAATAFIILDQCAMRTW